MLKNKKTIQINFKKASSLISKISEMVQNEEYSPKVMQQNLAVMGLLKSAHKMLLENHLDDCFKSKNPKTEEAMKNEISKAIRIR